MRLLADECLSRAVVERLRRDGHDVAWGLVEEACGDSDRKVLARSIAENRLLITEDRDFGELTFRLGQPALGVVLIKMDGTLGADEVAERVLRGIGEIGEADLRGMFTVIDADRTRQRALPPAADRG